MGVFAVGSHLGHAILILKNGPTGIDGELYGTQEGTSVAIGVRASCLPRGGASIASEFVVALGHMTLSG